MTILYVKPKLFVHFKTT